MSFVFGFWPNEIAVGVDTLAYVDIGPGSEAGGNLTRPKTEKKDIHTQPTVHTATAGVSGVLAENVSSRDRHREVGRCALAGGCSRRGQPARSGGYFSPASMRALRMFCFGGSGQVVNSLNAQGGL